MRKRFEKRVRVSCNNQIYIGVFEEELKEGAVRKLSKKDKLF